MDGSLKTGLRKLGPATCRVVHPVGIPLHMRERTREIKSLQTEPEQRGKGFATSLMHKLCREADASNFVLILQPVGFADPGMDDAALASWYEQFGFQVIQREPVVLMARAPGSTPRLLALKPVPASIYMAAGPRKAIQ